MPQYERPAPAAEEPQLPAYEPLFSAKQVWRAPLCIASLHSANASHGLRLAAQDKGASPSGHGEEDELRQQLADSKAREADLEVRAYNAGPSLVAVVFNPAGPHGGHAVLDALAVSQQEDNFIPGVAGSAAGRDGAREPAAGGAAGGGGGEHRGPLCGARQRAAAAAGGARGGEAAVRGGAHCALQPATCERGLPRTAL